MSTARLLPALVALFVVATIVSGSVGDPTPGGFIRFDDIRRSSFTALAVQRTYDEPSSAPLVVRVSLVGDAAEADISTAAAWLRAQANVVLVRDAAGAPLYLTNHNLIATSGPGAIGATVRSGMAVEMRDPRLSPCVVAHEVLHFLGLHHVEDPENLMYPRCATGKLASASLLPEQRATVSSLASVVAVTPAGLVTWASR